jgi:L-glutamine-phosphate cytidylyltransferase
MPNNSRQSKCIKGFITAAGLGSRFGAVTRNTNKGLLEVEEKSVLMHSLEKLQAAGIDETYVVGGYQFGQLRQRIGDVATLIFNPFYEVSGILGSFWSAQPYLKDCAFVFTTSDHFYCPTVLADCLQTEDEINIVVQQKSNYTKEDLKVILDGAEVVHMGKDLSPESAHGEFGGMAYFSQAGSQLFFRALQNMLENGQLKGYVADALMQVRTEYGVPIRYSLCHDGSRIEIDSVHDLREARKIAETI